MNFSEQMEAIVDTMEAQRFSGEIRTVAAEINAETERMNIISHQIEEFWRSQASAEYCRQINKLVRELKDISDSLEEISKRVNQYIINMTEADKAASRLFGAFASKLPKIPSASSPTSNAVIDRYKAKDYSSIGCGGTSGYLGDGGYYYQDDASGGDPAVAPFNDESGWVSCTFSTMYRLHKKGLGYPFATVGNTSGGQWFDNYAGAPENRYTGVDGFRQMINEYMASDQTEPLRNIVVSFDSGEYGHVMFIDGIHKDGEITFYDNSWGAGFETKLYANDLSLESAMAAVDNAPVHGMQVEEFLQHYGYMHMNGAVIIGNN